MGRPSNIVEREEVAFSEKRALKEGRTIVFADQSGFYLLSGSGAHICPYWPDTCTS
jgi:hypothetical protein